MLTTSGQSKEYDGNFRIPFNQVDNLRKAALAIFPGMFKPPVPPPPSPTFHDPAWGKQRTATQVREQYERELKQKQEAEARLNPVPASFDDYGPNSRYLPEAMQARHAFKEYVLSTGTTSLRAEEYIKALEWFITALINDARG